MELTEQTKLEILCAYLPHGVELMADGKPYQKILGISLLNDFKFIVNMGYGDAKFLTESNIQPIQPILRHPDDMTEEELQKLADITDGVDIMLGVTWQKFLISLETAQKALNYLHSLHIDTFGAIEAGWAIRKESK